MKRLPLFILFILFTSNFSAQAQDIRNFCATAFEKMKSNDVEWFKERLPDSLDLVVVFDEIAEQLDEEERIMMRKELNGKFISLAMIEMNAKFERDFNRQRGKIKDWSTLKLDKSKIDIKLFEISGGPKTLRFPNTFEADIPFQDGAKDYSMELSQIKYSEHRKKIVILNDRIGIRTSQGAMIGDPTIKDSSPVENLNTSEEDEPADLIPPKAPRPKINDEQAEIANYPGGLVYSSTESLPEYKNGENALYQFLADNIEYPKDAAMNNIQGIVYIEFIIEKSGRVSNVKITKDIGGGCGQEAKRVISKMPKWKPGRNKGETVRTYFTLPVEFSLGE